MIEKTSQTEKIQRASRASFVYDAAKTVLMKKHDDSLNLLKGYYRVNDLDLAKMTGLLGQLIACDDILKTLERDIKSGEKVSKEMHNDV